MEDSKEDDGVLSRWSKRKRGIDALEEQSADNNPPPDETDHQRAELEKQHTANREAAEAIDLETIDEESDLSIFMEEGVPSTLRKAALAKLWRSNPVFANVDGLVDYDDNFADPKLIMKTFTSAYQVGRGYLKEVLEEVPDDGAADAMAEEKPEQDNQELEEAVKASDDQEVVSEEPVVSEIEEYELSEPVENFKAAPSVSLKERLGLLEVSETKEKDT